MSSVPGYYEFPVTGVAATYPIDYDGATAAAPGAGGLMDATAGKAAGRGIILKGARAKVLPAATNILIIVDAAGAEITRMPFLNTGGIPNGDQIFRRIKPRVGMGAKLNAADGQVEVEWCWEGMAGGP